MPLKSPNNNLNFPIADFISRRHFLLLVNHRIRFRNDMVESSTPEEDPECTRRGSTSDTQNALVDPECTRRGSTSELVRDAGQGDRSDAVVMSSLSR